MSNLILGEHIMMSTPSQNTQKANIAEQEATAPETGQRQTARNKAERYVGRVNVDILSGWETGMKGRERVNGKLYARQPPEHLSGVRLSDWYLGFDGATKLLSTRQTVFAGRTKDGPVEIKCQGWVARRSVISKMEKMGVWNSVDVFYLEGGEIVRAQNCGI